MTNRLIPKILSIVVMVMAMLVITGWIFDIGFLKSVRSDWVTMKFVTAISFICSGLILFFVVRFEEGKRELAKVVLLVLGFLLFLLMATMILSFYVGMKSGIEDFFIQEGENAIQTTAPGKPSMVTVISFMLISTIPFLYTFQETPLRRRVIQCGCLISGVGILGLVGYIFNLPFLYYSLNGFSTAMAFHTAILFVLLGLGFVFISQGRDKS